jgi:hypothetical protein
MDVYFTLIFNDWIFGAKGSCTEMFDSLLRQGSLFKIKSV